MLPLEVGKKKGGVHIKDSHIVERVWFVGNKGSQKKKIGPKIGSPGGITNNWTM